jgi:hypothetical protein
MSVDKSIPKRKTGKMASLLHLLLVLNYTLGIFRRRTEEEKRVKNTAQEITQCLPKLASSFSTFSTTDD